MSAAHDTARFKATDEPELVEASFCCRLCLRCVGAVIIGLENNGGAAWAYCQACEACTKVALNAKQILRLTLAPPRSAPIFLVLAENL